MMMLPDDYLKVLACCTTDDEFERIKTIVSYVSTGEKSSQELENHVMEVHGITNVKEARVLIYKADEAGLITVNKKKPTPDAYPIWFYTENASHEYLKKKAVELERDKIDKIKEKFLENNHAFYCSTFCKKKLYTFEEMIDTDGKCPSCGSTLENLGDEQKKRLVERYVCGLSDIVDKQSILQEMYDAIFPDYFLEQDMEEVACDGEVAFDENGDPCLLDLVDMEPATKHEAFEMLRWVTVKCENDIGICLVAARRSRDAPPSPIVS